MTESKASALILAQDSARAIFAAENECAFDYELCKSLTVVSASLTPNPQVSTRLTVTRAMCNRFGTLHGGAISTIFDVCTTLALITARGWKMVGVTRTLSITCLAPVSSGEEIEIEGEVMQIGKKLVHILAKMTLVRNGRLVATGVHDRVIIDRSAAMTGQDLKL